MPAFVLDGCGIRSIRSLTERSTMYEMIFSRALESILNGMSRIETRTAIIWQYPTATAEEIDAAMYDALKEAREKRRATEVDPSWLEWAVFEKGREKAPVDESTLVKNQMLVRQFEEIVGADVFADDSGNIVLGEVAAQGVLTTIRRLIAAIPETELL